MVCAVISICGAYMALDHMGLLPFGTEPDSEVATASPGVPPVSTGDVALATEALVNESPTPSVSADLRKEMEEVWPMLDAAYKSAMLYTALRDADVPFVAQNGYLYDAGVNEYVTTQTLINADMFDKRYEGEKILLLYLRPVDAKGVEELQMGSGTALALFAAYETKDGIAVLGGGMVQGVLYRESMQALLKQYEVVGGEIERPSVGEQPYAAILAAIREEAPFALGYDVRYMASDGQFAYVAVSKKGASQELFFYILENVQDEGGWQVRPLDAGVHTHHKKAVNQTVPNLNIQLLPAYAPGDVALFQSESFAFITEHMLEEGLIGESDMPVTFVSGNDEMVYMVLRSGVKFFGKDNGAAGWEIFPMDGWLEAEEHMRGLHEAPPLYIIRQE